MDRTDDFRRADDDDPRIHDDDLIDERDGGPADGPPEAERPRGRWRRWLILVLVLLGVGILAGVAYWYLFVYSARFETTDDAFVQGQIVRVAPQVSGRVAAVPVKANAEVAKGEVLVRIDDAEAEAALALRKAELDEAQSALGEAQAKLAQARSGVDKAQASLQGAKVKQQNDQREADRYTHLANSNTAPVSQSDVDNAVAAARQAAADVTVAEREVENQKAGVNSAEAAVTSARAAVEAAKAQVKEAQVTIDRLTVSAPIAGQVVKKSVNVGSYVAPGDQMMAIVPQHLYVTANFKETQLSDIRIGDPVDISVDAFPDVTFHGTVQSIQHGSGEAFQLLPPENATGNYVKVVQRVPVRISIDSPSPQKYPIGPGMSVVPTVHVQ